jgi:two-component system phosphate regulon sensor histidine kinase PhoR
MASWRARVEYIVAGVALAVIAAMVGWWSVLARRLAHDGLRLQEELHFLQTGDRLDLAARGARYNFMVLGELSALAVALISCVAVLFYLARQRKLARVRMERLLQFTSHELKTPIAGVRALLQTLELGAVPEERKQEFLRRGLHEVDRLEHLAETILMWQRSVAADGKLTAKPLDARQLVKDVLEHRARTGVAEAVEVVTLPEATVLADGDAFRVILENLLDNARKYGGGKTHVAAELGVGTWQLSVRDGGQGFSPDEARRMFDPFKRHHHQGMTHGSGLGLYISRQLAVRMRGELTAHSDGPGHGAVFTVSLPLDQEAKGR